MTAVWLAAIALLSPLILAEWIRLGRLRRRVDGYAAERMTA